MVDFLYCALLYPKHSYIISSKGNTEILCSVKLVEAYSLIGLQVTVFYSYTLPPIYTLLAQTEISYGRG